MDRDVEAIAVDGRPGESGGCSEQFFDRGDCRVSAEGETKSGGAARKGRKPGIFSSDEKSARASDTQKNIDEIKRAEDALSLRERQFAAAQRIAGLGSWVFDCAAGTVDWSGELFHIFGYETGEIAPSYEAYLNLVHPNDRTAVVERHGRALREQGTYRHEHRLLLPDGSVRFLDTYGASVADDAGNIVKITGTAQDITPRKLAEEKLRENEEWLLAIFDASRDGILVESDGKIIYINKSYARMLGYETTEELCGRASTDLISPDDAERMTEYGKARLRGESMPPVYAFHGRHKDGSLPEMEAAVSTSLIAGEQYVIAVVRDLGGRNRAAQLVKESEERYRFLSEGIMHQVWTSLPDGRLDYANRRAKDYFGITDGTPLGESWQNFLHPDDVPACVERWTRSLANGEDYHVHFRLRRADGEYRWHSSRATAGRDADGKIFKWFGTNTDINDQKLAEESLRKSEERFQLAARATNDAMWEWDIVTNEVWWNEAAGCCFGHSLDGVEDKLEWWRGGIHPEEKEAIERSVYEFLDGGEQVWTGEYRFECADGKYAAIVDRRIVLRDEEGNPLRMLGSVLDISERREAEQALLDSEERLLQSQKMEAIGTLTGGVAHDFNNLLTAIVGNTQLALRNVAAEDETMRGRLNEIEKAADRAAVLTRQLLAFSRRQHLERRTVNLNDTVSEISKLLERIIGEDVEFSVRCAPDLRSVFADPAQIEQVVMNLAVNARDAMPNGGRLTIETANVELDKSYTRQYPYVQPGKYVQISVSDDGTGMCEETKARIFEPFFTTKGIGKGTGLGLSMAYGIVKQHDGHINVYSELGYGTTFKIFLPVDEKAAEAEQQPAECRQPLSGGTETILVAEDEKALRKLAKDVLENLGYTVLLAKNGEEAVRIYAENRDRIDLLLLDVVMPRMGGSEAYEQIRALSKTNDGGVPLIFMTGYSSDTVQSRFVKRKRFVPDADAKIAVLQKPYNVAGLGQKVRRMLDEHLKSKRNGEVEK